MVIEIAHGKVVPGVRNRVTIAHGFVRRIVLLIYDGKSVSCALDMNLFAFELRVQRNLTKCVLKYHVCAIGLTSSTQRGMGVNLLHLGHVFQSRNIDFSGF